LLSEINFVDKRAIKRLANMSEIMDKTKKIYVAGHSGLVGTAIMRQLDVRGYNNIVTRTHSELDLADQISVRQFFAEQQPAYVILAAAKVGGIHANRTYPADFIYQNLMIQTNVIDSAYHYNVQKLIFLGSSCIYPKLAKQPMNEDQLLAGYLEETNEAYAIAKIAGVKMCKAYNQQYATNYMSMMPTNLYGIGDNYDLQNSHVIPALIRKFHEGKISKQKQVALWGTGTPKREFLCSDDMADACLYIMENYNSNDTGEVINIGSGKDISIHDVARLIAKIVGFNGSIVYDNSMPDGTMRKLLDVTKLSTLGWQPKVSFESGLRLAYDDFLQNYCAITRDAAEA